MISNNIGKERMRIYALSLQALKQVREGEAEYQVYSVAVMSPDRETAREAGIQRALNEWPTTDGWTQHAVSCCEVPDRMVWKAVESIFGEPVA